MCSTASAQELLSRSQDLQLSPVPIALWAAFPQPANANCSVATPWRIFVVTVRTPTWRQTGLCHDQPSGVLVLFSKLSIHRAFVIKSCSLIFLVFTSVPQMLNPPLSLRYIQSTFPALIRVRGLLTVPLALQNCQAVKEESAAARSAIDLARVCRQQGQPPLQGCNTEISGLEKHLLHLPSYLGRYGPCHVCPVHPTVPQDSWQHQAPLEKLPGISASTKLCSLAESRDFSRFHLWKMIFSHGLYLTTFCLCIIKSLEQDGFVSFSLIRHLAVNASQIPHPEPSSCLTMWHISSWSSLLN